VYALREVIYFLIFIKLLDISSLDIAGPKNIPFRAIIEKLKACSLEGIHQDIIDVS
jgi:hypothetical protein